MHSLLRWHCSHSETIKLSLWNFQYHFFLSLLLCKVEGKVRKTIQGASWKEYQLSIGPAWATNTIICSSPSCSPLFACNHVLDSYQREETGQKWFSRLLTLEWTRTHDIQVYTGTRETYLTARRHCAILECADKKMTIVETWRCLTPWDKFKDGPC